MAVRTAGHTAAPAAVIAHGAGSSSTFIVEAFGGAVTAAGLRLVTYDLRGHGASDPVREVTRHRLADHVADLATVVAAHDAVLVGGVSLGAHAAAALAARDGVPALVLCMPAWTGRSSVGEGPHAAVAAAVAREGLPAVLAAAVADTPPWLGRLLDRDWRAADEASLVAALTALDGGEAPTLDDLRRIGAPTGVVAWPDDPGHPLAVARTWAEALPHAELVETSLDAVGADLATLGDAAVRAWRAASRLV